MQQFIDLTPGLYRYLIRFIPEFLDFTNRLENSLAFKRIKRQEFMFTRSLQYTILFD
ncbi:hypothetical protein RAH57_18375 [Chryseobacterium sp. CKR4-1]|uniref:hypothetical protein n=1 Tax=Chryseobacterium sp. CKR4-1 TaxID=3068896 RepID=UPI00279693C3|nr:hypothetical protein [Chryseobacterium sp. CKR4-1]MDQ1805962.1 hypothetical protein [Chryseobacterium sp. CKR4-1]